MDVHEIRHVYIGAGKRRTKSVWRVPTQCLLLAGSGGLNDIGPESLNVVEGGQRKDERATGFFSSHFF